MTGISGLSIHIGSLPRPIGPGAAAPTDTGPRSAAATDAATTEMDFDQFARMSPAQQMRAGLLQKLGVTQDQLNAMSPDARKAIEDKFQALVKQQVDADPASGARKGLIADITA